jgi:glycosyltransferase involved in cell wall biosynthesis
MTGRNANIGMSSPELSIIIPFYNEESCCEQVLQQLVKELDFHRIDYELLPVNNGSADQTARILDRCAQSHARIRVVTVPRNEGYGWGILSGLRESTGRYVGYVDGDMQIAPSEVVRVFQHLKANGADLCKGKRITRFDGFQRKLISKIYNGVFRILFACRVNDINAKPKILRRTSYQVLHLNSKDWFIDAELILKAHALGMRIEEVDIEFLSRKQGASKVRWSTVGEFIRNILLYRFSFGRQNVAPPQSERPSSPV